MTREGLTGIDQGTLLAERMLGDGEVLRTLIAGGQSKDVILQRVVSDLNNDPVGQACFLRTLFRYMAREGNATITDRRDGALAILTNAIITPLVIANPTIVHDAYIEAVQQQTRENDPFSGSIDTLLEAGKAIAPHLSQDAQRRQQIIDTLERATEQFPTIDERLHIRSKIEDIKEAMSPNLIFDAQVEKLRKEGLSNSQIAERLERKRTDIKASAHRLIRAGRIEAAPKGRSVSEAVTQLDAQVEKLRKEGLSNSQIAERLERKRTDIKASARRLIRAGRIERLSKGPVGSGDSVTNLLRILQQV